MDTRPFFEQFLKKMFFAPRKAENNFKKISKFARNEMKLCKGICRIAWRVGGTAQQLVGHTIMWRACLPHCMACLLHKTLMGTPGGL